MTDYLYKRLNDISIYLANGVEYSKLAGENYVSFKDLDNLHDSICLYLVTHKALLSSTVFKFIRTTLNYTQKYLGELLGVSDQTIARYEKAISPIPLTIDKLIRRLYLEKTCYKENRLDIIESDYRFEYQSLYFKYHNQKWVLWRVC